MNYKPTFIFVWLLILLPVFVFSQNHAPIAINDTVYLVPGQTLDVNVLLNDYDPDGDSIGMLGYSMGDSIKTVSIPSLYLTPSGYKYFLYKIWDEHNNYSPDSSRAFVVAWVENKAIAWLDINNVKAGINAYGKQFRIDYGNEGAYYVPAGKEISGFSKLRIWLTGMDDQENIHCSSEEIVYDEIEYWPGPVANSYDSIHQIRWNKIWALTPEEIQYHINHWNDPGYEPNEEIQSWPGNGNATSGEAAQLAPYKDLNGNGIYEPANGEYPVIRGDKCLYYILNDKNPETSIATRAFGVELHVMAYAFNCPSDSAFNNTTFFNYRLVNRSDTIYNDCYFGLNTSWHLGRSSDNYLGCDTLLHSYFCYNGDDFDESWYGSTDTSWGYEEFPPALSVTFLNKPMTNYLNFNDQFPLGIPYYDYQFHNYQKGILQDSSFLTYGSWGYNGSQPTHFMFPGDPLDTLSGWTMLTAGYFPSNFIGVGSHGPFDFLPGQEISFDFAFVFGRDYQGNNLTSVHTMKERIETVKFFYDNDSTPCGGSFNMDLAEYLKPGKLLVFPNPTDDYIKIRGLSTGKRGKAMIYNMLGRCVLKQEFTSGDIRIYMGHLNSGMYSLLIMTGGQLYTQKIVKR